MAVKLNSELAAFFQTGDQPSEAEFGHLIDSVLPAPVELPTSDATLTKATYQGRTLIASDVGSNTTYTIEAPAAAGEWYKFVYAGGATDAQDHIFTVLTANYKGNITHLDTNADTVVDHPNGTSEKTLTLNTSQAFEVNMISYSTSVMYVWGWVVSADAPAFS
jgi:hypothetical protein